MGGEAGEEGFGSRSIAADGKAQVTVLFLKGRFGRGRSRTSTVL